MTKVCNKHQLVKILKPPIRDLIFPLNAPSYAPGGSTYIGLICSFPIKTSYDLITEYIIQHRVATHHYYHATTMCSYFSSNRYYKQLPIQIMVGCSSTDLASKCKRRCLGSPPPPSSRSSLQLVYAINKSTISFALLMTTYATRDAIK